MENKNIYLTIIGLLIIALVITTVGWVKLYSDKNERDVATSLAVCDKITNEQEKESCATKLQTLSIVLSKYEQQINDSQPKTSQ
jgi:hypothetical protein